MKVLRILVILAVLLISNTSCQRGDAQVSVVVQGQTAPHKGYNVGPDLYVEQGDPIPVSGLLIWIRGLDPNDL